MSFVGRIKPRPDGIEGLIRVRPLDFISIDPGDVHVGWCFWHHSQPKFSTELRPEQALSWLEQDRVDLVVIEDWRLYADKATKMIGSDMPTCRLIGAMQYLLDRRDIPWIMQGASIKKPTLAILGAKKQPLMSKVKGDSQHVQDAEMHGWHFLMAGYRQFEQKFGVKISA